MVKSMKRKWLAVGIILLFVSVTIAPTINFNTVKASNDNDLIEVTTQACGIKGNGNTTVKLTGEQADEVDLLFECINSKLDNATSRVESVRILHEAIIELDRYGLLPQGMSVEQVQQLITGWNQNHNQRLLTRQQEIFPKCVNAFCLLFMSATNDPLAPPDSIGVWISIGLLTIIGLPLVILLTLLGEINLADTLSYFILFNPFKFMNFVFIGGYGLLTDFHSFGLKGAVQSDLDLWFLGYTGLKISLISNVYPDRCYCLGSALAVGLG